MAHMPSFPATRAHVRRQCWLHLLAWSGSRPCIDEQLAMLLRARTSRILQSCTYVPVNKDVVGPPATGTVLQLLLQYYG